MRSQILLLLFVFCFLPFAFCASAQSPAENKTSDKAASRVMIYHVSDEMDFEYTKPKQFEWAVNIYPYTKEYFRTTLTKKILIPIGGMIAGAAVLCLWDKAILDGAQKLGDNLGIAHTNRQKTYTRFSMKLGENKFEVPLN